MSAKIYLHQRPLESVFELLGSKENDLTYSLGWALAKCPSLLAALLLEVCGSKPPASVEVRLQQREARGGITDIELIGERLHVIIEAKRGWNLPTAKQLQLYSKRLRTAARPEGVLVTMSECSRDFADPRLPRLVDGYPVKHVSWQAVQQMAARRVGSHAEKRLLAELAGYLERVVKMQDQDSNRVYVVSLNAGRPAWSSLSWIEMVTKCRHYFHIFGRSGWPSSPPNYLAFRYHGRLQSIHHVERYEVITNITKYMPELKPGPWEPHMLYWLGDPIVPSKQVQTGRLFRNARVWAALDLLLTCDAISDARDRTKQREGNAVADKGKSSQ
ncbi:MAG: hypothetical protein ACK51N_04650 [bacterium]|jgi:hypothetical protein|nr:hypothetical protein [Phycisphaerales bacterium]MCE2652969.1 hypothetical protein [Planctomycetaceae bacterium]